MEGVQEAAVTGAVGDDGADAAVDELDIPPPQPLETTIPKAHAAAGNHRRSFTPARVACCEHCIEISSLC